MDDPKEFRDYLKEWLEKHQKASEAVPLLQRAYELVDWSCEALSKKPKEAEQIKTTDLTVRFSRGIEEVKSVLPMIPDIDNKAITLVNTIAVSGANATYDHILNVGEIPEKACYFYYQEQSKAYKFLQRSHNRVDEVRELLRLSVSESTVQQFDVAVKAYYSAAGGAGERSAAALEMRTLLDNVQGDLFNKARQWPKENMTWPIMSNRLCPIASDPARYAELTAEEENRSRLMEYLSSILKRREGQTQKNIDDIWAIVLDHIFVVLNILNK
jgi:hypothetical protein